MFRWSKQIVLEHDGVTLDYHTPQNDATQTCKVQADAAIPQPTETPPRTRPSHEIPVGKFEIKLIWPVFIQAVRKPDGTYLDPNLDPEADGFLDHWIQEIVSHTAGRWSAVEGDYPPRTGRDSGPAYAEFCYFHPFVRNFLYVTRGDVRQWWSKGENRGEKDVNTAVKKSINRNLRILERKDLKSWSVTYGMKPDGATWGTLTTEFQIRSCWLYLFDTQVAMLELHLIYNPEKCRTTFVPDPKPEEAAPAPQSIDLNLRMVMKLQDILRRTYSPYWSVFNPPWNPGQTKHDDVHVPWKLTLKTQIKDGTQEIHSDFGNFEIAKSLLSTDNAKDPFSRSAVKQVEALPEPQSTSLKSVRAHREHVFCHREPYVVEVWSELLAPLEPVRLTAPHTDNTDSPFKLRFEQIQDDRATLMSFIAVGTPPGDHLGCEPPQPLGVRQITTGDWMRLAFLDDEGDSDCYPYSPAFFAEDPLQGYVYDRFWHPTGQPPAQENYHSTRWLCSGYGFSAVGNANDTAFFTDEHAGALAHFRYHYFALTLIAQFHRASLLRFKHSLAEDADALLNDGQNKEEREHDFRKKSERLAEELMRFRAMYWFTEVSNQMQGQELFAMFRKHLNLDAVYRDVCADADNAAMILRQMSDERKQEASLTIAKLGVLFVIGTLVLVPLEVVLQGSPVWSALTVGGILIGLLLAMAWSTVQDLGREICDGMGLKWIWRCFRACKFDLRKVAAFVLVVAGLVGFISVVAMNIARRPSNASDDSPVNRHNMAVDFAPATLRIEIVTPRNGGVGLEAVPLIVPQVSPATSGNATAQPLLDGAPLDPSSDTSSSVSQDINEPNGSNSNSPDTAPQNPNSGSSPPNQDAGDGGEAAASL